MHERPVIFLSGKITGDPNYKEKFDEAQRKIERIDLVVLNPAKLPAGLFPGDYARICFAMIDAADIVAFLPDWEDSPGARLEKLYCEYTLKAHCELELILAEWEDIDNETLRRYNQHQRRDC